jgi:hypothetical protein
VIENSDPTASSESEPLTAEPVLSGPPDTDLDSATESNRPRAYELIFAIRRKSLQAALGKVLPGSDQVEFWIEPSAVVIVVSSPGVHFETKISASSGTKIFLDAPAMLSFGSGVFKDLICNQQVWSRQAGGPKPVDSDVNFSIQKALLVGAAAPVLTDCRIDCGAFHVAESVSIAADRLEPTQRRDGTPVSSEPVERALRLVEPFVRMPKKGQELQESFAWVTSDSVVAYDTERGLGCHVSGKFGIEEMAIPAKNVGRAARAMGNMSGPAETWEHEGGRTFVSPNDCVLISTANVPPGRIDVAAEPEQTVHAKGHELAECIAVIVAQTTDSEAIVDLVLEGEEDGQLTLSTHVELDGLKVPVEQQYARISLKVWRSRPAGEGSLLPKKLKIPAAALAAVTPSTKESVELRVIGRLLVVVTEEEEDRTTSVAASCVRDS